MNIPKTYYPALAAAAITLVLCFFAFLAYNAWRDEPEVVTKNDAEIQRLQLELEQSKLQTEADFQAALDSMLQHDKRYKAFLNDTNGNREITDQFNEIRAKHRSLEVDSAVGLMHHRLAIEDEYRTRFNYSKLRH